MGEQEPCVGVTARATAVCHCGASASAPCPTLVDMPAAMDAIKAVGWAWHDGVGFACSAACMGAAREAAAIRQGRAQQQLFGEVA